MIKPNVLSVFCILLLKCYEWYMGLAIIVQLVEKDSPFKGFPLKVW